VGISPKACFSFVKWLPVEAQSKVLKVGATHF